jgi:hypothetical protein
MRAGHLAVLAALLSFGLVVMFGFSLGFNGLMVMGLSEELAKLQQMGYLLEGDRLKQYVELRWPSGQTLDANIIVGGQVYSRVGPDDLGQIFADPQFRESIGGLTVDYRAQLEQHSAQVGWMDRWLWRAEHEQALRLLKQQTTPPGEAFTPEALVEAAGTLSPPVLFMIAFMSAAMLLVVAFFPMSWVLWSLLMGTGFSYRIAGISLVRRDGRPAHRIQCVWRSLLIWMPVTALLAASIILHAASPEQGWLAASMASSALVLLIAYALLALWFPTRSLHDVLAGTWLVPR